MPYRCARCRRRPTIPRQRGATLPQPSPSRPRPPRSSAAAPATPGATARIVAWRWCGRSSTSRTRRCSTWAAASAPTCVDSASSPTTSTASRWRSGVWPRPSLELPNIVLPSARTFPIPTDHFDLVFSNEVIEHVDDDRATAAEMVRVTKPGGAIVAFAPNRLYPFETHGAYFGKRYVFGNIPLVNWLPDPPARPFRAARAGLHHGGHRRSVRRPADTTRASPRHLPRLRQHQRSSRSPGRVPAACALCRRDTPLHRFGLSHFLVLRKTDDAGG